jgi:hypothetical protein
VLVVAALLAGAGIGSAVFAGLWQHEASGRESAEQELAVSRGRTATLGAEIAVLRRRLDASRKTAAAAGRAAERGSAVVAGLARGAKTLVSTAGALESHAGSLTDRSHSLSALIATLDKDLAGLSRYVHDARGGVDPAFLDTQLGYLGPSLDRVGGASAALADEAGTYSQTVQVFVDRLSAYAKTIRPPARR